MFKSYVGVTEYNCHVENHCINYSDITLIKPLITLLEYAKCVLWEN